MDRYPSPEYLPGAMVEDSVPRDLAVRITKGYEKALPLMSDEKTHKWLMAMLSNLGPMGAYPNTALATLACPSAHQATRNAELAKTYGWKEGDDAQPEAP